MKACQICHYNNSRIRAERSAHARIVRGWRVRLTLILVRVRCTRRCSAQAHLPASRRKRTVRAAPNGAQPLSSLRYICSRRLSFVEAFIMTISAVAFPPCSSRAEPTDVSARERKVVMVILWLIGELSRDHRNFCFRLGSTYMDRRECWNIMWDVSNFFNFYRFR